MLEAGAPCHAGSSRMPGASISSSTGGLRAMVGMDDERFPSPRLSWRCPAFVRSLKRGCPWRFRRHQDSTLSLVRQPVKADERPLSSTIDRLGQKPLHQSQRHCPVSPTLGPVVGCARPRSSKTAHKSSTREAMTPCRHNPRANETPARAAHGTGFIGAVQIFVDVRPQLRVISSSSRSASPA